MTTPITSLINLGNLDTTQLLAAKAAVREEKVKIDIKAATEEAPVDTKLLDLLNDQVARLQSERFEVLDKYLLAYFGDRETAEKLGKFFVLEITEDVAPSYETPGYPDFNMDVVYRFEMRYRLRRLSKDELLQQGITETLFDVAAEHWKSQARDA